MNRAPERFDTRLRTLIAVAQVLDVELTALIPDDLPDLTAGR
jgi:hypothetical protein